MVKDWFGTWSKLGGKVSSRWEDRGSVVEVVVDSSKPLELGNNVSEEEEEGE